MSVLPDRAPFRESRDFRLLWSSGLITFFGSMMTYVALPFQIKQLTGSYVAVGLLGVIELAPLVVFGLWGGALADAVDRRTMVLLAEVGALCCSLLLLGNALMPHPRVWVIYIVTFLFTCCDGLQRPSLDGLLPRVVRSDALASAAAWMSMRWTFASIVGTAAGGVIAAGAGPSMVFAIDAATFLLSAALLLRLRPSPAARDATKPSVRSIAEGAQYAASRPELIGTYVVDVIAMLFAFPNAIFPFLAPRFGHDYALGLLYAAGSVGSLFASATSGWTTRVHMHGRMVIAAATVWGVAIAAVGLSHSLWVTLLCLALAGAADMVSGLFRSLIWNQTIPDMLRGRLAGIEMLSYSLGPQLGQLRVSLFARWFGLPRALVSGGLLCIAGTSVSAVALRQFWRYDARTNVHAVAERERRAQLSESAE